MLVEIMSAAFLGIAGYAVGYSGRFGLVFIEKGSTYHKVLGVINLELHCVAVCIALAVPPLTAFSGQPSLAYVAVVFIASSLFLYRLTPIGLHVRLVRAGGKRAKPMAEQERTRWPYAWTCGVGYVLMLAYLSTILPASP